MQVTIDIDAQLLKEAEQLARRKGQPLSVLVEQALRDSLRTSQKLAESAPSYGKPLTDEEIAESARVTFRMLDGEKGRKVQMPDFKVRIKTRFGKRTLSAADVRWLDEASKSRH